MSQFADARDAKEFLVAKIVGEAQREGISLSEVERKMLYFSETGWAPPDIMEVNDEFDRKYDQDKYEKKIARLIRNARKRARQEDKQEFDAWSDAIRVLSNEDHYLLMIVSQAGASVRPAGDLLKLWATAIAVVCIMILALYLSDRLAVPLSRRFGIELTKKARGFFMWVLATGVGFAYLLLRVVLGRQKIDRFVSKVFDLDRAKQH